MFYTDLMRSALLSVVLNPAICNIDWNIKLLFCVLSFFWFTTMVFHCCLVCISLLYFSVIDRGVCYSVLVKVDHLLLVCYMIMVFLTWYVLCTELIRNMFYIALMYSVLVLHTSLLVVLSFPRCHTLQKKGSMLCSVMCFLLFKNNVLRRRGEIFFWRSCFCLII